MAEREIRATRLDTERDLKPTRMNARDAIGGGISAGLVAGLVLWIVLMVLTAAQGGTVWSVMKGAAAPFIGTEAGSPQFAWGPVLLGTLVHFAISAAWGAFFGVLAYGLTRGATVLAGIGWGLVVWLVMYYVVLPLAGLGAVVASSPVMMAILTHLIFGLALGLAFLPYQRRVPGRPLRRQQRETTVVP